MISFATDTLPIRNPRTGEFDYHIKPPSQNDVEYICYQLRKEQVAWGQMNINHRVEVLQAWKKAVNNQKEALIEALCKDTGRQWESLLEADIVASSIDRWCGIAQNFFTPATLRQSSIPFLSIQQDLVSYPLVGVISPWNFPLLLSLIDTIPALLAGCSVIVKPSEVTPRFIKVINETIAKVPALANVFIYIEGAGETGAEIIKHADLVCFTGSTATGRKVYQAACDRFIPVFLELGGKDAALVFEGADLDKAASALLWGSTANAGQSCLSIERIYVQASVFEAFVEKLAAKASEVRLAYPSVDSGKIGPIISDKQVSIINDHLRDAVEKGARILTGSSQCELHGGGYYCRPTVLVNVNHTMKVMNEETFGPIMPVMAFEDKEEALRLANGTFYGLSGAVFAATYDEALEVAQQMTAGAVSINDAALTAVMHEGEKNSFKMSGIGGTRMGLSAIKRFMRQKAYIIKTNENPDPWWF
ncbi:MAG: aldehyde dehydrogenase family protein [Spirosomaceae bacterium]|nr:aldehyde dehydrogenase family protein [Spirosomataceae bacterium]